jgi:ribose/xylose/arabinose/galactoside ABC-type transport system permease subunit
MTAALPFLQRHGRILAVYALIVALIVIGASGSERFLTERNLFNVLRSAAYLGVLALGQMIVILTAGIDLSVGSMVKLSVLVGAIVMNGDSANTGFGVLAVLALGVGVGLIHGFFINRMHISPFIVTLASYVILRGVALTISTSPIGRASREALTFYDVRVGPLPLIGVLFIALAVALAFLLRRTVFGRHLYAVGGDAEVARLSGVRVEAVRWGAYVLCSLLASVCGLMWLSRMGVGDPTIGDGLELDAITAVIIGGTSLFGGRGRVVGTVGGVLLLALLANVLVMLSVNQWIQGLIQGVVIVAAVALYRQDKTA